MTRSRKHPRRRAGAWLLMTLFAVLFGVVTTHGLVPHDVAHGHGPSSAATGPIPESDGDSGHERAHDAASSDDTESPAHSHGLTGDTCLVVLTVLAALVLVATRRGVLAETPAWLRGAGPELAARNRVAEPPCLHRLSVLRC